MRKSFILLALFLGAALTLRAESQPQEEQKPPPLDPRNMDASVKPQDDFYLYANGGWLKSNPVPPDYSRWSSFDELSEKNLNALHKIAEKAASTKSSADTAPETQKVGDFYASGMDQKTIDAKRIAPICSRPSPISTAWASTPFSDSARGRMPKTAIAKSPRHIRADSVCRTAITTSRPTRIRRRSAPPTWITSRK